MIYLKMQLITFLLYHYQVPYIVYIVREKSIIIIWKIHSLMFSNTNNFKNIYDKKKNKCGLPNI